LLLGPQQLPIYSVLISVLSTTPASAV